VKHINLDCVHSQSLDSTPLVISRLSDQDQKV